MAVFGTLLVAAPALAMQQQGADSGTRTLPQTMPGELTLYEMTDYNGEAYVIVEQQSKQASYLSFTITVRAESRAQIDALYRDLVAHELVLMAL